MTTVVPTHRVAIVTRYAGPTDHTSSRIIARAYGLPRGRSTLVTPYDPALSSADNHARAAIRLYERLGWDRATLYQGATHEGYVFTIHEPRDEWSLTL